MQISTKFDPGEEVYVVTSRAERFDEPCSRCGPRPLIAGLRCVYCQGYRTVFKGIRTVWEILGPSEVSLVNVLVKESGVSFTYCIPDTWDKPHDEEFVFKSEREADACRRVHLR
jgi:hypothetical protein